MTSDNKESTAAEPKSSTEIKFTAVLQAEIDALKKEKNSPRIGLAFSGGGIRSATFNLGILQGFAKKSVLDKVDYLSTVSGGGYIGAWLSSLIYHDKSKAKLTRIQDELKQSTQPSAAVTNEANSQTEKAITWLRNYSNYLTPKTGLFTTDTLAAIAQWTANTFLNQLLLLSALILVMFAVIFLSHSGIPQCVKFISDAYRCFKTLYPNALSHLGGLLSIISIVWASIMSLGYCRGSRFYKPEPAFIMGVVGLVLILLELPLTIDDTTSAISSACAKDASKSPITPNYMIGLGLPIVTLLISTLLILFMGLAGRAVKPSSREWWHRIGGINIGFSISWLILFSCALYLPYHLDKWFDCWSSSQKMSLGGVLAWLVNFATAKFGQSKISSESTNFFPALLSKLAPYLAIAAILVSTGYLSYTLYKSANFCSWVIGLLVTVGLLSWRLDINLFSLHNFYRNRLTRCYLGASNPDREKDVCPFTGFAESDDITLAELKGQKPIPIINTALNISDGSHLAWQQRKAAAFAFTPYYSGFSLEDNKEAWIKTECYDNYTAEKEGPKLGSLIATSGAAASPNMGYHTNPAMGFIMTIFNARLGRWFSNPSKPNAAEKNSLDFNLPYLLAELSTNTNEESKFLYLSDGGHFENLGIYELVRRECKVIVAIDAGEDGDYQFEDLGNTIRKCKVDFGVTIDININELHANIPSQYGDFKHSNSHFAIGTIYYKGECTDKEEDVGYLLYIKSSLTGDEPTDLINYKLQEPKFPHHSTVDQFFDESQFESYRCLGEHIADTLCIRKPSAAVQVINSHIPNLIKPVEDN